MRAVAFAALGRRERVLEKTLGDDVLRRAGDIGGGVGATEGGPRRGKPTGKR